MRKIRKSKNVIRYTLLILNSVILLTPFYYLLVTSFKTYQEAAGAFTWWPNEWVFTNFREVLEVPDFKLVRYFLNTLLVFVLRAGGTTLTCGLAAYGFVRFRFKYKNLLFMVLMSVLMVPSELLLIPMYEIYIGLNWMDTYLPLWIGSWFGTDVFAIFLFRQFFMSVPNSYFEAAKVDGCGEIRSFLKIMVPLTIPVFTTILILNFTGTYNDIYSPSLYIFTQDKFLVAQSIGIIEGMYAVGGGRNYPVPWNLVAAVNLMFIIPVLALFFSCQKAFMASISGDVGLKG